MLRKLFVILLLTVSLCGCQQKTEIPEAPAVTEEPATIPAFEYQFSTHVISELYKEKYGEAVEEEFYRFCDALSQGETSFPCISREHFFELLEISGSCFPFAALIERDSVACSAGRCTFTYRCDAEEIPQKMQEFIEKVTSVIEEALPYEEEDQLKALRLYTAVSRKDTYDQEHSLEDMLVTSSYRAITEDIGICQEIAGEYIYYLLQVGVEAFPCSSLSRDRSLAHAWAVVELDGQHYHCDPTYGTQYPDSLFFFGMNEKQREYYGDFDPAEYVYAENDRFHFTADSDRFRDLWLAERYEIDPSKREIRYTEVYTGEEKVYEY